MFDFESDKVDRRFSRPGEKDPQPTRESQPQERATGSSSTRQSNRPVSSPEPRIPAPPPLPNAAPPRERVDRRRGGNLSARSNDWALVVIAVALIAVVLVVGVTLVTLSNSNTTDQNTEFTVVTPENVLPTPVDARTSTDPNQLSTGEKLTLDDGSSVIITPWNGSSRLNILLMGIDRRPGDTGLGYRTDTMMLASFDPKTQQLGILSIPRDLFVQVPGYSARQRINTALSLGELQRPGYGPTLAMQTVQYNLGMGVNTYIIADFTALIKLVDAIGGIDVDVPTPIADYQFPDMNYGYDPLILSAGPQHMDGYTAQKYARTRHGDSDFDRAKRQQQVLFAIRDRILHLDTLPQLIVSAPSLYGSMSQNVYTQLSINDMIQLGLWLKDLPADNIHTGVIDQNYVRDFTTTDGAEVLMPYTAALPTLLAQVFGSDYNSSQP